MLCYTTKEGQQDRVGLDVTETTRVQSVNREEIFVTIIDACVLHLDAPREVNVLLSDRTMHTWNAMFLDNLARDGMFLYARGSLPASLATGQSLQERLPTSQDALPLIIEGMNVLRLGAD